MKRFVHYLNHAFYADADIFLKEKHSAFLKKMHPKKKSQGSVFNRLASTVQLTKDEDEDEEEEKGKNLSPMQLLLRKTIEEAKAMKKKEERAANLI